MTRFFVRFSFRLFLLGTLFSAVAPVWAEPLKALLVYIPQTDDGAAAWIKFMDRHPQVRMVLALSPRFHRLYKDAALKDRLFQLQTEGRLGFALQIPNAPILALLDDTNVARRALPAGTPLPEPPYSAPDDALQHIAQAKAAFAKLWTFSPTGIVLPYGAASPTLLPTLSRSGLSWAIAALGFSGPVTGAWRLDSFMGWNSIALWDGAPVLDPASGLRVRIWDERDMKATGKPFDTMDRWVKEFENLGVTWILPDDSGLPEPQKFQDTALQLRTWTQDTWLDWIGVPEKNAVWTQLRRTREAIEVYKNSGTAQIPRLDAAMSEFFTAQNSTYLLEAGNPQRSEAERQDRAQEFQGTLNNIFRLIGKPVPDDLFSALDASQSSINQSSMTIVTAERPSEGLDLIRFTRTTGFLRNLEIQVSSQTLSWAVTLSSFVAGVTLDLYFDINGLPNVGTTIPLSRGTLGVSPDDAWEYALRVQGTKAVLYRTQSGGSFAQSQDFPVTMTGTSVQWVIPRSSIRGNPRRWGVQIQVQSADGATVAQLTEARFARLKTGRP